MSKVYEISKNKTVGKWGKFELVIKNPTKYKDPYSYIEYPEVMKSEIILFITYTRPDESTIDFWGFYDGDNIWKARCMPDQLGTWKYKASFSDDSGSMEGTFECVESDIPGLIHKDEKNPMWFGYKGGKHGLVRSFHVGDRFFASNWSDSARKVFLDWVGEQGYNMLSVASHYLCRETTGRGLGWNTPKLWPIDPLEYQKMESILDDLAVRHMMVFPFAGFFGRDSKFPSSKWTQVSYIKYVMARLGAYWNVVFNVAGPEPILKPSPFLLKEQVDQLGKTIQECNVFDHIVTVHNQTGDDDFIHEEYTDFGTLQGPKTTDLTVLSKELLKNHASAKPLYAQETLWSRNIHGHPDYTDEEIRKNTYVITMSAAALNYSDNHGDSSSGFSGTLDMDDRLQSRHDTIKMIWDFFETIPYYNMSPRQDLVDKGYCLAEEGKGYLVYLDCGGTVNVSVSEGTYQVEWINARNTKKRQRADSTNTGENLTAPDHQDWLVYLTSK